MSSTATKMITLQSSEKENFEVDENVLMQSQTIKHMIEDECVDNAIPLPNVSNKILSKVIEYLKKHVEANQDKEKNPPSSSAADGEDKEKKPSSSSAAATADDSLKSWDANFVKVDQSTLFEIILAANYLDIKSLLDLTCQATADMMIGKTHEEIRETFNIKNDFTPEEEDEIRRENQWVFEWSAATIN